MRLLKKLRVTKLDQGGFTLIELLVVIGILAILLAITLIAINPSQHFQGARNAQRQSDVVAILDAIYEYEAANKGNLPANLTAVTSTPAEITNDLTTFPTGVDLCTDLVPTYIADLPLDPTIGSKTPTSSASACGATKYDTGYTIAKSASNRFTIAAPEGLTDGNTNISVTR
jgi:prepilin-type N-terminal cleavage/methylation domain-containing protein